jgi:cysteine desulfurase
MIYLDHNASTPIRPEVRSAMEPCSGELYANPSSLHAAGQRARAFVEAARQQVAALVGAAPAEVVFTSGGTEGDHLALLGATLALRTRGVWPVRVACSTIEHHAVHGAADVLRELGCEVEELPVERDGRADPQRWRDAMKRAHLVSLMLGNNETGVLQPVAEVAGLAHAAGAVVHCDAVQAAGKVPFSLGALGVDYLVVSAHKMGGPKGAGALAVRTGAPLEPLFRGSAHEHGRRGGTENLSGIVGLGAAAECAARELNEEGPRLARLRDRLEAALRSACPDLVVHGAAAPRLPNTVNASFPGARSDRLLLALDARGVAVSAGAACASGSVEPSPVLRAMGVPRDLAVCALRFSVGRTTTAEDVEQVAGIFPEALRAARAAATVGASG